MAYNPTPLDTSATSEQLIFEGGNLINTNFQEILTWMNEKQTEIDAVETKNTQQDQEISDLQTYLQDQQNIVPDPTGVGAFAMAVNLTEADIGYEEEVAGTSLCPINTYSVVNTDSTFTFADLTEAPYQQRLLGTWVSVTAIVPTQVTVTVETDVVAEYAHTWSSGLFMRIA